jgi:tRNA-dihydrouridine synthase
VKKIKNKARGGHMLKDVPRAVAILRAVRDVIPSETPITMSIRRGFDDTPESVDRFYEILETAWSLGVAAVRVHARTVEQKYIGPSRWGFLADVKRRYPNRTIFGSGDLFTAEDVVRMLKETGVDVAWIARGAIGNPWIFTHARQLLENPNVPLQPPTIAEQRLALEEHFGIAMQIHGEQLAGRRMRKMGIKYSRFHPAFEQVKRDFIAVHSLRDWSNVLGKWYAEDRPGVWPAATAADEVNSGADMQSCEVG